MSRLHGLLMVAGLALTAGSVGCAHCDTCDDFPAPCTGPNCGYPYNHGGGDVYAGAPAPAYVDTSASAPAAPAPAASLAPANDAAPSPAPSVPAANPEKK